MDFKTLRSDFSMVASGAAVGVAFVWTMLSKELSKGEDERSAELFKAGAFIRNHPVKAVYS